MVRPGPLGTDQLNIYAANIHVYDYAKFYKINEFLDNDTCKYILYIVHCYCPNFRVDDTITIKFPLTLTIIKVIIPAD